MQASPNDGTDRKGVVDVAPKTLAQWLNDGDAVLVDVRENFEHAEERIADAELAPLSAFDPEEIRRRHGSSRVVFHCRSGKRSKDAAERYRGSDETAFHLAGGIEGWKTAGYETERPAFGPRVPVMRQVQIAAGSLVVLGVGLGAFVSAWFLLLAAFVGCGLVFAGTTGWCGMAMLLAKAPWNRRVGPPAGAAPCSSGCV